MNVRSEIPDREAVDDRTSRTCGSRLSLERGSADHLFRSSLKSNKSTAAIRSALSDNRRVQAPSGTHSNGTGVIENGIDLIRASDLDRALGFTGMEREPPSEHARFADDRSRKMVDAFVVSLISVF